MRFVNHSAAHRTKPIHTIFIAIKTVKGVCWQLSHTYIIMFHHLFSLRFYKISSCTIGSHTNITISTQTDSRYQLSDIINMPGFMRLYIIYKQSIIACTNVEFPIGNVKLGKPLFPTHRCYQVISLYLVCLGIVPVQTMSPQEPDVSLTIPLIIAHHIIKPLPTGPYVLMM